MFESLEENDAHKKTIEEELEEFEVKKSKV